MNREFLYVRSREERFVKGLYVVACERERERERDMVRGKMGFTLIKRIFSLKLTKSIFSSRGKKNFFWSRGKRLRACLTFLPVEA